MTMGNGLEVMSESAVNYYSSMLLILKSCELSEGGA